MRGGARRHISPYYSPPRFAELRCFRLHVRLRDAYAARLLLLPLFYDYAAAMP